MASAIGYESGGRQFESRLPSDFLSAPTSYLVMMSCDLSQVFLEDSWDVMYGKVLGMGNLKGFVDEP